eukprot:scaffold1651_cov317-Pinguiococcus_pyrenoidosus.AAC.11
MSTAAVPQVTCVVGAGVQPREAVRYGAGRGAEAFGCYPAIEHDDNGVEDSRPKRHTTAFALAWQFLDGVSQVSAWAPLRARVSGCRGYALSVAKEPASAQTQVETAVDWTIAATAQALRLSERDTVAFLQGALSPKQMSVALLRKELDVRGYTEESAMCESAKDLRDLLQIARRQEAEDEAGLLRKAKVREGRHRMTPPSKTLWLRWAFANLYQKQTPADKELIDRYLALEKDDTIQGNVDVGELAPSDDLPEELLLSELQRRAPKEAEALLADDASYSAEELKWALLAAREEKPLPAVEEGETDAAPVAEKRPSEMSVREILKELEARGALDVPTVP